MYRADLQAVGCVSSTVQMEIANRKTGNAQITSISRDSSESVSAAEEAGDQRQDGRDDEQITAEPMPISSELRPP